MEKCFLCGAEVENLEDHISREHNDIVKERDMTPRQLIYHNKNRNRPGTIGVCSCGRPKEWLEKEGKYSYYCGHPDHAAKMRQDYINNTQAKYGVDDWIELPEHQRIAVAERSISTAYTYKDGKEVVAVGSVELALHKELEKLGWEGKDVDAPAPFNIPYTDHQGIKRNHIPDAFLKPLNLVISVKDGMENPNRHPNMKKDRLKNIYEYKAILNDTSYNYIQIEGVEDVKRLGEYLKAVKGVRRYVMPPRIDVAMLIGEGFEVVYTCNRYTVALMESDNRYNLETGEVTSACGIEFIFNAAKMYEEGLLVESISELYDKSREELAEYLVWGGEV